MHYLRLSQRRNVIGCIITLLGVTFLNDLARDENAGMGEVLLVLLCEPDADPDVDPNS